jgi:hypothetical protein
MNDLMTHLTQPAQPILKDLAQKKAKEMAESLTADLPIFEKAGFGLIRVEIEIGVTPNVTAMFSIRSRLNEAQQKELLDEVRSNRKLHGILSLLFKAETLVDFVDLGELKFYRMKVTLGTLPKVSIIYDRPTHAGRSNPKPAPEVASIRPTHPVTDFIHNSELDFSKHT